MLDQRDASQAYSSTLTVHSRVLGSKVRPIFRAGGPCGYAGPVPALALHPHPAADPGTDHRHARALRARAAGAVARAQRRAGEAPAMSRRPDALAADESGGGWTGALQRGLRRRFPLEELLPTRQPSYVRSWTYVFGAIAIAALIWLVVSGSILVLRGPDWWHHTTTGKFFNSLHFWCVQIFFIFMVLHLWAMFWGAAWRDGRAPTWV